MTMSRLLLVDDDFDTLQAMGDLLSFHLKDVEVDRASSGPDALELLSKSCTYDAVITDIKMPIMDGLTLNLSEQTLYEAICLRKDGSRFAAEIHGRAMPYVGRHLRVTAIRDISLSPAAVNSSR